MPFTRHLKDPVPKGALEPNVERLLKAVEDAEVASGEVGTAPPRLGDLAAAEEIGELAVVCDLEEREGFFLPFLLILFSPDACLSFIWGYPPQNFLELAVGQLFL